MKTLALDLSTSTGWAFDSGVCVESGVQVFDLRRGESPGMRFLRFRQWLAKMLCDLSPEVVVYEMAHHRGGAPTELCVGLVTRVQEMAAERGIEYCSVHSSTLKKWATGNGAAKKDAMQAWASGRFPTYDPAKDAGADQADALAMLEWVRDGSPQTERKRAGRRKAGV